MSPWRRHHWSADEITVARNLTAPGWHDAIQLGGHALPARKVKKIAERYVTLGYAEARDGLTPLSRRTYRARKDNMRDLIKIGEHQL